MPLFKQIKARKFLSFSTMAGIFVLLTIGFFYANGLGQIFQLAGDYQGAQWWADSYILHVIQFSFMQALLSASLSVGLGLVVARAFFYQNFPAKHFLLKIISLTFVLPVLVAIFGLMGVYGNSGWLAKLLAYFNVSWQDKIYGLSGILIAHLFFNIPLATRLFVQALQAIPNQQRQLAAQLNLRGWHFVRWVEWHYLRQQLLPAFSLIFMLCFTSFTVVLTLGGGPQYSTLEAAIYQAIMFDFELPKAAMLAILQLAFCVSLFMLSNLIHKPLISSQNQQNPWRAKQSLGKKLFQIGVLFCFSLFVLLPLLNALLSALFAENLWQTLQQASLWRAFGFSLAMAICSGVVALTMALALLLFARQFQVLDSEQNRLAQWISNAGMMVLAIPTIVLAIGLFLALRAFEVSSLLLFGVVTFCNALAAMPFVLRILAVPLQLNQQRYHKLCQSLGIQGWARFRLIEWANLREPMQYAFALAAALSLGDFTAIALFGSQGFTSLPYLLYQQLGNYRSSQAAVTAGILLLLCLALFGLIENQKEKNDSFN